MFFSEAVTQGFGSNPVKATGSITLLDLDILGINFTVGTNVSNVEDEWAAGGTLAITASNFAAYINNNPATCLCSASANGATITLTARVAGSAGNSIPLSVSAGGHTTLVAFNGGAD